MTRHTRCVVTSLDPSIRQRRVGALGFIPLLGRLTQQLTKDQYPVHLEYAKASFERNQRGTQTYLRCQREEMMAQAQ